MARRFRFVNPLSRRLSLPGYSTAFPTGSPQPILQTGGYTHAPSPRALFWHTVVFLTAPVIIAGVRYLGRAAVITHRMEGWLMLGSIAICGIYGAVRGARYGDNVGYRIGYIILCGFGGAAVGSGIAAFFRDVIHDPS